MRTNFTLMAILGLLFFSENPSAFGQTDTIYVKADATGINDGTSWDNAYSDLQDALSEALSGDEIWVAQGIYYPDTMGGLSTSTFWVDKNIKLLGGFNGGGGALANEQDPDQYITRLSGDLNQDDVLDSVLVNREDNAWTVVTIGPEVDGNCNIDGFYIQNGHADGDFSAFQNERGGGCFSFGAPVISRCVFDNNYASQRGGGLYFHTGNAEGAQVVDCYFRENVAPEGAGAMCFIQAGDGVTFTSCDFDGNRANNNGGALRIYNSNCLLNDCQFQFNTANRGGAVDIQSIWDDNETQILNSFFFENQARNGGAVNFQTGSGLGAHNNFLTIDGCEFFGNQAIADNGGRQGGALRVNIERTSNGCGARIRNSDFIQNASERDAGAIAANLRGETMTFLLENTMFTLNTSEIGGGIFLESRDIGNGLATFRNCNFFDNLTSDVGGAIVFFANESSRLDYLVESCNFFNNVSSDFGGAISIYGQDTARMDMHFEANLFDSNQSGTYGGAVSVFSSGNELMAKFNRNTFRSNSAVFGAVLGTEPSDLNTGVLQFENCLLVENEAEDAVLSIDSFPQLSLINCTLADNIAPIGLLALNKSKLFLQNSILYNNGDFEFGTDNSVIEVTTGGGNLIGDTSMDFFLGDLDTSGLDPLFEISPDGDYFLMESSPAVDMGVLPPDVSDFDLAGNERVVNCIDAGAYESPYIVSSACLSDVEEANESLGLLAFPNPADDIVRISWNKTSPEFQLDLLDVNGRLMVSGMANNVNNYHLDVSNLKSGVYFLRMTVGSGVETKRLVVQ